MLGQDHSDEAYPNVGNLKAFGAEAGDTSLPGYLQHVMSLTWNQWLTYRESSRIVHQDGE